MVAVQVHSSGFEGVPSFLWLCTKALSGVWTAHRRKDTYRLFLDLCLKFGEGTALWVTIYSPQSPRDTSGDSRSVRSPRSCCSRRVVIDPSAMACETSFEGASLHSPLKRSANPVRFELQRRVPSCLALGHPLCDVPDCTYLRSPKHCLPLARIFA